MLNNEKITLMTKLSLYEQKNGKKEIKCTGNFGYISEGEYLEIEGEEVFHDIYGEQIKVTSYKVF